MATEVFYFSGICAFPHLVAPTSNFDKNTFSWKINVKLDNASKKLFEDSGLSLKIKDGYVGFRRNTVGVSKGNKVDFTPPIIHNADGTHRHLPVNPGDRVTVKVAVYDTKAGKGHRMESVRVDEEGGGGAPINTPTDDFVPF